MYNHALYRTNMRNRMNILVIFLLLAASMVGCVSGSQPQSNQPPQASASASAPKTVDHEIIKRQAQELSDAMIKGDYNKAADLTHPKLVDLMGGRTQFISETEKAFKEMEAQQVRIVSNMVGEPQDIVEVKNEIYAIVPTAMRMKVPDGILASEVFMIGVSKDGGQNWTFVDAAAAREGGEGLKMLFPDAASKLRVPELKRPVFHKGLDK